MRSANLSVISSDLRQQLKRLWTACLLPLYKHTILVLSIIFCGGTLFALWYLSHATTTLMQSAALQGTTLHVETLLELRNLYTSEVVDRVRGHNIEVTHDYLHKPGAIPLPATFSMELGRRVSLHDSGMVMRLYSNYPFPWRKDGGAHDDFERQALVALQAHPQQPYYRFEDFQGRASLRYARADVMRAECVSCHNSRPDSPKRDWKVGDVRGVLEIIRPLDRVMVQSRADLRDVFILFGALLALGLGALTLVITRLRRVSVDLEDQVAQRTEELHSQQEELRQSNEELEEKNKLLADQKVEVEYKNREIEAAKLTLEERAEQLALTSRYKSEFLSNMSHELRTPLNSLLILAQLLAENAEHNMSGQQIEYAKTIQGAGKDLLALINDILDLSKIESGTVTPDLQDVSFANVREQVERAFRHVAESRSLGFGVELAPGLPPSLYTDSQRLQQVLKNLLSNAFKFTQKGQVSVRIAAVESGWSVAHDGPNRAQTVIGFHVTDTGIGLPADKQKLIFEAFQQADTGTARKYGGTGLGLSISREIARLLGGELRLVASSPGKGSTFVLYLPLRAPEPGQ